MENLNFQPDLQLHIYGDGKIVKSYACNLGKVRHGTIKKAVHLLDVEAVKTGDKLEIAGMLMRSFDFVCPLLLDMFPGLTPEEVDDTELENLTEVFQGLFAWVGTLFRSTAETNHIDKKK